MNPFVRARGMPRKPIRPAPEPTRAFRPQAGAPRVEDLHLPDGHTHGGLDVELRSKRGAVLTDVGTGALAGGGASLLAGALDLDKVADNGVVGLVVACVVAVAAIAGAAFTAWARAKYD